MKPLPRAAASCLMGLATWLAAGCADPPTRFYSLLAAPAASAAGPAQIQALAGAPRWELMPVTIPAQVDQPQMVVRQGDGTLAVLEFDRWVAPLGDEIHAALAERIAAAMAGAPAGAGGARWRLEVAIERFDSAPGRYAHLEAGWTLAQVGGPSLRCHGVFDEAVGPGLVALAAAQRANVARLGETLAGALRAAVGGAAPACSPAGS
ncbi:MAG: membrane integrity-associated transporter subunit PqiC [Burkholderiales bacterium]|nr:membrane integrity-associated transporter subunit PqiC [Burkholderiales bacterium]MDE2452875.1 membrane integrity-associated transporter subunit PqiC [Burkholderiales bacterium]